MSRYTNFPRNTKQAFLRSCAASAREAVIRAQQVEQAYREHTPVQNTDELLDTVYDTTGLDRLASELGIDLTPSFKAVAA